MRLGKRDRVEKKEEAPAPGGTIASSTDLEAGDRVVYPKQGVYRVTGLEQKDIAGQRLEFVRMSREEDGASVLVPLGKVATIGLRRVASADDIEGVFHYLGASYDDPELDWKVRHRDNVERLIAGGVLGVAEVVKGLHSLARMRPLPAKERELYDSSRHLLVNEISVSLGVSEAIAEDYVDYALMPPAGVKLPLKPPPTPVELKGPPWKRKKPVAADDEDDLGLADLGIDLGALEGDAEEAEEGEGEGEKGAPAESEEGAEEGVTAAAKAPVPAKAATPAKSPAIIMKACPAGGGHMNYGFLRYSNEFWTSDDTDARSFGFVHALIRDGAYASLLHSHRRTLHLRAAEWYAG
ncbi:MAG TPA: CarD family transcriptional regulator, partial [Anaeromyxobacteraceae bacterium]|nr:CarD family transcriptional regulator [Anaeromyxobacteraceae bacterium]